MRRRGLSLESDGTSRPKERPIATTRHRELHDLLSEPDGRRLAASGAWPERRAVWLERLVDLVYGGMPPPPVEVEVSRRSQGVVRRLGGQQPVSVYRVRVDVGGGVLDLRLQVFTPRLDPDAGAGATEGVPVVIDPDGCWWNLDDASVERFLGRGVALARFDRTDVAADPGPTPGPRPPQRDGLFQHYPDARFGALAAWAWGIQRVVDALHALPAVTVSGAAPIDASRIAVTGFSRGGKAALLAGATDQRIGLVHAHASGAGGAAPFLVAGDGSEGLRVVQDFPGWFGPRLAEYVGREVELPVDQHVLLAAVMPRPLLLTCGVDDLWANPEGTRHAADAARDVARLLGRPDALVMRLRPGGHHHGPEDWQALLDFIELQWLATSTGG